jgi:ABC-2 family transporter protein
MNPRRVIAILYKDLRDACRDGRIVVLLLMPIAIALIPTIGGDPDEVPTTEVAIVDRGDGGLGRELRDVAGKSADIRLTPASDAPSARALVAAEDVEVAIVVAPGAQPPRAEILVAQDASPAAQSLVALVPDALTRAAGQTPPAQTQVRAIAPTDQDPVDVVEPGALSVVLAIVLLVTFVAMMVVPIQTAEELETGTFGALRLAATGPEILAAKALAGFVLGSAGVGLTVLLTDLEVHDPPLFFGAAFGLIVSLVGFGLLLGLLLPSANAINTYGGFLVFPFVALATAAFFVDSGIFATMLELLPFSQAAMLLGDGVAAEAPFDTGPVAWLVIAVWAVVGYASLARIASRREI